MNLFPNETANSMGSRSLLPDGSCGGLSADPHHIRKPAKILHGPPAGVLFGGRSLNANRAPFANKPMIRGKGSGESTRAPTCIAIGQLSVGRGSDLIRFGRLSADGLLGNAVMEGMSRRQHSSASGDQVTAASVVEFGTRHIRQRQSPLPKLVNSGSFPNRASDFG